MFKSNNMKKNHLLLFTILGIIFWFTAAMAVRFLGGTVFSHGNSNLILAYILAVPLLLGSIALSKLLSGKPYRELDKPVAWMTGVAAMLDGIALSWFQEIYSERDEVAMHGAAWILFGAGVGLVISLTMGDFLRNSK